MNVLDLAAWGIWEWWRAANFTLCLVALGAILTKARRWTSAPDHDRVFMLGVVLIVLAIAHASLQRALEGVPSGSWTVFYTGGLVGFIAAALLAPSRPTRSTQSGDPMVSTTAAADAAAPIERVGQVAKLIVVGIVAVLTVAIPAVREQDFSLYSILSMLIALGGAPAVYVIAGTRGKTIAAAIVAGLQVIVAAIDTTTNLAGVTADTWMAAGLAIAAVFGVGWIPNAPPAAKVELTTPVVTVPPPAAAAEIERATEAQHRVNDHAAKAADSTT